jgi:AcrR family transcriptional regulator
VSRKRILDGAAQVFSERGYQLAGMDEIASRSGVAKGSLYYHFAGKAELFKTVVTEGIQVLSEQTASIFDSGLPVREQIRAVIRKHVELYLSFGDLANVVFRETGIGVDEPFLQEIKAAKEAHVRLISDMLRNGSELGICRQVDFGMTAWGLLGLLDAFCRYRLGSADRPDSCADAISDALYDLVGEGILLPQA